MFAICQFLVQFLCNWIFDFLVALKEFQLQVFLYSSLKIIWVAVPLKDTPFQRYSPRNVHFSSLLTGSFHFQLWKQKLCIFVTWWISFTQTFVNFLYLEINSVGTSNAVYFNIRTRWLLFLVTAFFVKNIFSVSQDELYNITKFRTFIFPIQTIHLNTSTKYSKCLFIIWLLPNEVFLMNPIKTVQMKSEIWRPRWAFKGSILSIYLARSTECRHSGIAIAK